MPSYKRKRDEAEDSDGDEPSFGRQILPVANLPEDFNAEPADGMQYLFTVRRDARYLPHVTRAANPFEVAEIQASPVHSTMEPHPGLPSSDWRAAYEKHFRNFRKNAAQSTINVQFTPRDAGRKVMPDKRERDLWWAFIAGKPEAEWNPPKKLKQKKRQYEHKMRGFADDDLDDSGDPSPFQETWHINDEGEVELALVVDPTESLPTPSGTPVPQEPDDARPEPSTVIPNTRLPKPREPTPSLVRQIDHRMSIHLLMYFAYWINLHLEQPDQPFPLTETHARWIFSLLARIEEHISADDMSLLRNLARACLSLLKRVIQKRSAASGSRDGLMGERSCWMIISAVGDVWGQRDLWQDAEAMLTSL